MDKVSKVFIGSIVALFLKTNFKLFYFDDIFWKTFIDTINILEDSRRIL